MGDTYVLWGKTQKQVLGLGHSPLLVSKASMEFGFNSIGNTALATLRCLESFVGATLPRRSFGYKGLPFYPPKAIHNRYLELVIVFGQVRSTVDFGCRGGTLF